jgi:hypothetical protein
MKITDLSSDTFLLELEEDSTVSIASINQWYRANIGSLNNLIHTSYEVSPPAYEIVNADDGEEIGVNESAIYKCLYLRSFFSRKVNSFLGAAAIDVIQVQQDGINIRGYDRNQLSKTYLELKKQNEENLKQLLNNYKYNRATPLHVEGDDRLSKTEPQIFNPLNNASSY